MDHLDQLRLDDIERRLKKVSPELAGLSADGLSRMPEPDELFMRHACADMEFLLSVIHRNERPHD